MFCDWYLHFKFSSKNNFRILFFIFQIYIYFFYFFKKPTILLTFSKTFLQLFQKINILGTFFKNVLCTVSAIQGGTPTIPRHTLYNQNGTIWQKSTFRPIPPHPPSPRSTLWVWPHTEKSTKFVCLHEARARWSLKPSSTLTKLSESFNCNK